LIQPSSRSSPTQAAIRSRNPVQNGSITASSSRPRWAGALRAMASAMG
jgi:hypothetical protein